MYGEQDTDQTFLALDWALDIAQACAGTSAMRRSSRSL